MMRSLLTIACVILMVPALHGQERYVDDSTHCDMAILVAFPEKNIFTPQRRGLTQTISRIIDLDQDDSLRVGHAGIILVNSGDSSAIYFDFGRYEDRADSVGVRPVNSGVVRSGHCVPCFQLPDARITEGRLVNADTLISLLGACDQFFSYGMIKGAVCYGLCYTDMYTYACSVQAQGYLPYGAPFHQYCSRFAREVAEAGGARFRLFTYSGQQLVNQTLRDNPGQEMIILQ